MGARAFFFSLVLCVACVPDAALFAQESAGQAEGFTPGEEFQDWITELVREQLPAEYVKKKNWGHTAKTLDGISVQLDDGQLKTHRKYRQANDGTWQMYRVKLKDPAKKFDVRIGDVRELASGRVAMKLRVIAIVEVFGRQSLWEHGVQIFSLAAEADAKVRLSADLEVTTRLEGVRFPPAIHLDPEVTAARFDIPDFRLRRVGELDGPVVRSLSHATREVLEDKLASDNEKLVAMLNKQIAKQEKKLTLSLGDWTALGKTHAEAQRRKEEQK